MKLLTDKQRAFALKRLAEADDDILLSALAEIRQRDVRLEAAKRQLDEEFGVETCAEEPARSKVMSSVRPNVSPGTSSITKIGAGTRSALLTRLAEQGVAKNDKSCEHLKLLWSRGDVKFDGKEYYL